MFQKVAKGAHRQIGYRADIEGLRAVAVLLVVGFHAKVPGFQGGFIGVDIFFVISGYLISALLLKELQETGSIDFRGFYARRARRLLPAAFVMIATTVCASSLILAPLEQALVGRAGVAASTYISNFWFMRRGLDYFAPESTNNPLLHTWSLSVEEQFYLIWPALLMATWLYFSSKRSFMVALAAGCAVSLIACFWIASVRQPWAFYLLPTRAWEFGAGALTCLVSHKTLVPTLQARRRVRWVGLLLLVAAASLFSEDQGFPGWMLLIPILATCALLLCGETDGDHRSFWPLTAAPMQYAGHLSYSIYLWHWPTLVLGAVLFPDLDIGGRLSLVAASLLLAGVSYYLVENPIRRNPWLVPRRTATIALGVALTLLGASAGEGQHVLALKWANSPSQLLISAAEQRSSALSLPGNDCMVGFTEAVPKACTFGNADAGGTIVLLGDSHAGQWFTAVERFASRQGLKLVTYLKTSCPISDVPIFNARLMRWNPECQQWRDAALKEIVAIGPLLVVISSHQLAYVPGPGRHSAAMTTSPHDWVSGVERSLRVLTERGIRVAYIRDTPRMSVHVPTCLSRAVMHHRSAEACGRSRSLATDETTFAGEVATLRKVPGTSVIDVTDRFCDRELCPAIRNGIVVYRDNNHVSEDYVRGLQEELAARLDMAAGTSGHAASAQGQGVRK